jgi:hypothetical protein
VAQQLIDASRPCCTIPPTRLPVRLLVCLPACRSVCAYPPRPGCTNFNSMCAMGSKVAQCANVTGITTLPPTRLLNDQVRQQCSSHQRRKPSCWQWSRRLCGRKGGREDAVLHGRRSSVVQTPKGSASQHNKQSNAAQRNRQSTVAQRAGQN